MKLLPQLVRALIGGAVLGVAGNAIAALHLTLDQPNQGGTAGTHLVWTGTLFNDGTDAVQFSGAAFGFAIVFAPVANNHITLFDSLGVSGQPAVIGAGQQITGLPLFDMDIDPAFAGTLPVSTSIDFSLFDQGDIGLSFPIAVDVATTSFSVTALPAEIPEPGTALLLGAAWLAMRRIRQGAR